MKGHTQREQGVGARLRGPRFARPHASRPPPRLALQPALPRPAVPPVRRSALPMAVRAPLLAALAGAAVLPLAPVCAGAAPGGPPSVGLAAFKRAVSDAPSAQVAAAEWEAASPAQGVETLPYLGPLDAQTSAAAPANYAGQFSEAMNGATYAAGPRTAAPGGGYQWRLMPQGLIYRSYLAGAKESRLRSVWNHDANDGNIWDLTLGGNVGLVRYGTQGDNRPEGWQLGLEGAGLVRLDVDEHRDVDAADFRGGVPLTWGDAQRQFKFAYYHLSSHLGDEFLLKHPGYDRLNYSRDVLVWGVSQYFHPDWRCYGEVGYAFAYDVAEPWETQFGVEWAPAGRTGGRGAPFVALNGALREEVDWGGNAVIQAGWAWRRSPASGVFRLGVEYYNGKDDQFSFYDESVDKVGFGLWFDY